MDRRIEMYLSAMIVLMTQIQYMSLSLPQCVECAIASHLAELRLELYIDLLAKIVVIS